MLNCTIASSASSTTGVCRPSRAIEMWFFPRPVRMRWPRPTGMEMANAPRHSAATKGPVCRNRPSPSKRCQTPDTVNATTTSSRTSIDVNRRRTAVVRTLRTRGSLSGCSAPATTFITAAETPRSANGNKAPSPTNRPYCAYAAWPK